MWSKVISVQVKIAKKFMPQIDKKKNLDRLCEVLTPGSTVGNINPTTSTIKESNRTEVRVSNSDTAKFGTKNRRKTELAR